jgi:exodeoxyribonuclease VII small subunit
MARKQQSPPRSFEDALRELEQILTEIESGQIGLEESLARYERGNFLIQHCRGVLNTAEKQIELLSRAPNGGLRSEPMSEPPESEDSNSMKES